MALCDATQPRTGPSGATTNHRRRLATPPPNKDGALRRHHQPSVGALRRLHQPQTARLAAPTTHGALQPASTTDGALQRQLQHPQVHGRTEMNARKQRETNIKQ